MRYGLKAENLIEHVALLSGKLPVAVIDSILPLVQTRAIISATRAGVFEAMRGPGDHRTADVAKRCSLDEDCLEHVMRVLLSAGYVVQGEQGYRLSSLTRKSLMRAAEGSCAKYVEFGYLQWKVVEHLDEVLKTGTAIDFHHTLEDEQGWEVYQRAMLDTARVMAPFLVSKIPVPPQAKQLIDLGGSHGYFGAAICRKYPPMKSVVYDLEAAVKQARPMAAEAGISDIVEHRIADLMEADFGKEVDVALLANIIHHFDEEMSLNLLRRVRASMSPGGVVAIWDMERRPPGARAKLMAEAMALMFRVTSNSKACTADEYGKWLSQAGFQRVEVHRPPMVAAHVLIVAHA